MLFNRISNRKRKRQSAWLYSVVFNGVFSTCLILLLLSSFFVQPFHKAMAMEAMPDEQVPPEPVAADVREQVAPEEPSETQSEVQQESVSPAAPPNTTPVEEVPATPEVLTETTQNDPPVLPGDGGADVGSDDADSTGDNEIATTSEEQNQVDVPDSQLNLNSNTTQIVQVEGLVNEDNYYQFSKESCIEVGNGTYHCSKSSELDIDSQSVAYAEVDNGGDTEIFVKTSRGKVQQITDNAFDDTNPHYDAESMRVVWQRLIDGRYQVVLYSIMEDKETQLTFSKTNNMEPKVSDVGIVWQAWDNNDWEIMFFDGNYTEQLTDNDSQDIAPVMQDGYVLWNVLGGEEQQARVYSIKTRETTSIIGYEGGSIINPRFVLVYDTEFPNGDVVTQSFDPATGLSEPVAAKPAQSPIDIPESDPVGEIRALIGAGKSKDEKQLLEVDSDSGNDNSASSTSDGSLNLKSGDDIQQIIATTTVDMAPEFELTEYDLVIPQTALDEALADTTESTQ